MLKNMSDDNLDLRFLKTITPMYNKLIEAYLRLNIKVKQNIPLLIKRVIIAYYLCYPPSKILSKHKWYNFIDKSINNFECSNLIFKNCQLLITSQAANWQKKIIFAKCMNNNNLLLIAKDVHNDCFIGYTPRILFQNRSTGLCVNKLEINE